MRIQRLQLENFRGFASLDLDLSHGQTTVLVGVNGSGKTAVLRALSWALSLATAELGLLEFRETMSPLEVRAGSERCVVGGEFVWQVPLLHKSNDTAPQNLVGERFAVRLEAKLRGDRLTISRRPHPGGRKWSWEWHSESRKGGVLDLPLLAEFWLDRYTPSRDRFGDELSLPHDPLQFYASVQERSLTNRDDFLEWFRLREDYENETIRDQRTYVDPQLEAVRRALVSFLPGLQGLRVRRRPTREPGQAHLDPVLKNSPTLTLHKDGTLFAFNQLSDGEQGLLVLVGDIARRLAITHPGLADPLQGRGIVLIDEVELHLHPQWQRTLIPNLERAFPNLQFIVTTHSPQVLSLVPREQVKILRDFKAVEDPPHTLGRDSNAILYEVMGVDQYPPFAAEKVRTVARLIDAEKWGEARAALAELARDFGANDAEVIRLGSMLEFMGGEDEAAG